MFSQRIKWYKKGGEIKRIQNFVSSRNAKKSNGKHATKKGQNASKYRLTLVNHKKNINKVFRDIWI